MITARSNTVAWLVFAVVASLLAFAGTAAAQSLDDALFESAEFGSNSSAGEEKSSKASSKRPSSGGLIDLDDPFSGPQFGSPKFNSPIGGGLFGASGPKLTASVSPTTAGLGEIVTFTIRLDLPNGGHTYPINDQAGSTQLLLAVPPSLEAVDDRFLADREPEVIDTPGLGPVPQYEHDVTWTKRFRVVSVDDPSATVDGKIDYQVCDTKCVPHKEMFSVDLKLSTDRFDASAGYVVRPQRDGADDPVQFQFELVPPNPQPDELVTLAVTMIPDAGWHGLAVTSAADQLAKPTEISIDGLVGLTARDDQFRPSETPVSVDAGNATQLQHDGPVTWQRRYRATASDVAVQGTVRYQLCDDERCLPPNEIAFSLGSDQPEELLAAASPISQSKVDGSVFASASSGGSADARPLWHWFGLAFLGGLILNVMPCVLPVIAVKVLGFVQQAGESRGRILALNTVYSLGVLLVFGVLGVLSVAIGLGFGEQNQSLTFSIVMCTVVIIASLSLLGVFEIPIPGFIGNAGAGQQEGLMGAFLTGVVATVLATPCTGPFVGAVVAWGLKQSVAVNMGVWLMMGVGMASPYMLAGVFPRIIEFLPKPGMWMIYFKQVSGFVLLASSLWFMNNLPNDIVLPFLFAMVGVAFGCWIIGTFRPHESLLKRWNVALSALLFAGGISFVAYQIAQPADHELPWQPFTGATLEDLIEQGEPVLVDFTADWCLICKQNEKVALDTEETSRFVRQHCIATLYADYTSESAEIKAWLERFDQSGVPLTVIYPKGGGQPIKLTGPYTQSTLLDTLETAVKTDVAAAPPATRVK